MRVTHKGTGGDVTGLVMKKERIKSGVESVRV